MESSKIVLTFAPLSALKNRKYGNEIYDFGLKITITFFEVLEQLKSFSSLAREIFQNNTFEIRAKI